jgi:phosphoribosylformylglycinamidine synthase
MLPRIDLKRAAELYRRLHEAIGKSWVKSCHDVSDGGLAVAIAESVIGSGLGARLTLPALHEAAGAYSPSHVGPAGDMLSRNDFALFAEGPARMIITIQPELKQEWENLWNGFSCTLVGEVVQQDALSIVAADGSEVMAVACSELSAAWKTPLPFD